MKYTLNYWALRDGHWTQITHPIQTLPKNDEALNILLKKDAFLDTVTIMEQT